MAESGLAVLDVATRNEGPFHARDTHARVLRPGNALVAHSQDSGWRSLYAAHFREAPFRAREAAIEHPSLIYHIAAPTQVARRIDGASRESTLIGPRRFCLTPGDAATEWEHSGNPEILQIYLRRSVVERAAADAGQRDTAPALRPRFAVVDPLLEQLALAVLTALGDGTADDGLYVDTIAQLMALHLVRHHGHSGLCDRPVANGRLPTTRVRRLVEFIEAHLADPLSLDRLAEHVDVSPLYLPRMFKATMGQAPHRYVLDRRIERAKVLLRDTDLPLVDVAAETGFSSQSHLSTWFLRRVGTTPGAYRRQR